MRLIKRIYRLLFIPIVPLSWLMMLIGWFADFRLPPGARHAAARMQIVNFMSALNSYKNDTGDFPAATEGLQPLRKDPGTPGWRGPYLQMDIPCDPWGYPYTYEIGADGTPELRSPGLDRAPAPGWDPLQSNLSWMLLGALGGIGYPLLPHLWRRLR
jgi:hypothetical protein